MALTTNESRALDITRQAFAAGRRSVTASLVAAQAGEDHSIRRWSGVMSSLARKGLVCAHPDGFVQKTFYTLPEEEL